MDRVGLRLPNEIGGHYAVDAVIDLATRAEDRGYHSLWVPESTGRNSFMLLTRLAMVTDSIRLGTGIVNVFSRSPSLIAMSVATLADVSDGRALLGIGASSRSAIEEWHGLAYERPLRRVHETIDIVNSVLTDDRVDYHGEVFDVDDYPTELSPEGPIPIYNAALGEQNRRLTGRFADGWLPIHVPLEDLPAMLADVRDAAIDGGRDPDDVTVAPYVLSCVSAANPEIARDAARSVLGFYIGVMEYYAGVFRRFGFEDDVERIRDAWAAGGADAATDSVSDNLLDAVAIAGTPEDGRRRLAEYRAAGVDVPIVALPAKVPPTMARETIDALGPQ